MKVRPLYAVLIVATVLAGIGVSVGAIRTLFRNPVDELEVGLGTPSPQRKAQPRRPKPAPRDSSYVGSDACRKCHAGHSESFASHPMSRSACLIPGGPVVEDYALSPFFELPKASGFQCRIRYLAEDRNSKVVHAEETRTEDGELVARIEAPIRFAIGSGQRGRSYAISRDGRLFMSPLTWYSQRQIWDLSPGYITNNLHFDRRIVDACVHCHTGRTSPVPDHPNQFAEPVLIEESIGCERCHGPGQKHVEYHESGAQGADPMLDLTKLEPRRRDALCLQCHLAGEERLTRYGRTDYDFRPGDQLEDIWAVFVQAETVDETKSMEAVSQSEQMISSRCYTASEGKFGCISCHDPHSSPDRTSRISFYRDRCAACHEEERNGCSVALTRRTEKAENSCIECHMPSIEANDVPHTSQTDHRVLKDPAKHRNLAPAAARLDWFNRGEEFLPAEERNRAIGIVTSRAAEKNDDATLANDAIPLLRDWVDRVPDDLPAVEALAAAMGMQRDIAGAVALLESGLTFREHDEALLRRLLLLYHEAEDYKQAESVARRLIAVNPYDYEYHGRLAHLLGMRGDYEAAIRHAKESLKLRPVNDQIYGWLVEVYEKLGRKEEAREAKRLFDLFSPVSYKPK
jgi:hypothetical protein